MALDANFIKTVELDYLKGLSQALKESRINLATAQTSAKTFLTLLPFISDEDIQTKLQIFVQQYTVLAPMYQIVLHRIEEKNAQATLEKMREHLKNNNIDAALQLVKT